MVPLLHKFGLIVGSTTCSRDSNSTGQRTSLSRYSVYCQDFFRHRLRSSNSPCRDVPYVCDGVNVFLGSLLPDTVAPAETYGRGGTGRWGIAGILWTSPDGVQSIQVPTKVAFDDDNFLRERHHYVSLY